jgi:hypothetical protein
VVAAGRWPQAARLQLAHLDLTECGSHGGRWSSAAAAPPVLDAARGGAPRAGGQQTSTAVTSTTATPQPQDSAPAAASASCFPSSFTGTPRGGAPPPRAKAKLEQASRPPVRDLEDVRGNPGRPAELADARWTSCAEFADGPMELARWSSPWRCYARWSSRGSLSSVLAAAVSCAGAADNWVEERERHIFGFPLHSDANWVFDLGTPMEARFFT